MPDERPEQALVAGGGPSSAPEIEQVAAARWQPHEEVIDLLAEMLVASMIRNDLNEARE